MKYKEWSVQEMSNNLKRDNLTNQELLQQFLNVPEREVNRKRLEQILDDEMNKPEDQIDLQLVDDILAALETEPVDKKEANASWDRLDRKIEEMEEKEKTHPPHARKRNVFVFVGRVAAVAASLIILFFISFASARAMKWTFLLKYLNPIAQTFGISLDERKPEPPQSAYFILDQSPLDSNPFSSEVDVPEMYKGYRIRLNHVPERFTFDSGYVFSNPYMIKILCFYQSIEEGWLQYSVNIFPNEDISGQFDFEKTEENAIAQYAGMKEITIYKNADDGVVSSSWIDRNAHYGIYGSVTEAEMNALLHGFEE